MSTTTADTDDRSTPTPDSIAPIKRILEQCKTMVNVLLSPLRVHCTPGSTTDLLCLVTTPSKTRQQRQSFFFPLPLRATPMKPSRWPPLHGSAIHTRLLPTCRTSRDTDESKLYTSHIEPFSSLLSAPSLSGSLAPLCPHPQETRFDCSISFDSHR